MSRRSQLLVIIFATLAITLAVSHLVARTLHIRTQPVTPLSFGSTNQPIDAVVAGSSLTFYGMAWADVASKLNTRMQGWAVPAGSVVEMEVLQASVPKARVTFLGVGASDLNENYVSDFRSEIVPLSKTISDTCKPGADWTLARRVLSQYPLSYLRLLFPTAGRSTTIMVGLREGLRSLRPSKSATEPAEQRAVISSDSNTHQENIASWPEARLMRNIGDLRAHASGSFEFNGPKRDALFRFMQHGAQLGKMVVVVIPESPAYRKEFASNVVQKRFEAALSEAKSKTPGAIWVRLDAVPELQSNEMYWDLVHLNAPGQAIATRVVMEHLAAAGVR